MTKIKYVLILLFYSFFSYCQVVIKPCPEIVITPTVINEVCEQKNGAISINLSGGNAPYSFAWTGQNGYTNTGSNIQGLSAGTYTITATEENGCKCTGTKEIEVNNDIILMSINFTVFNPSCGQSNGGLFANVSGGNAPYSFAWTGPNGYALNAPFAGILSLEPGTYTVVVTDDNGCTGTNTVTLVNQDSTPALTVSSNNSICNGNNGQACVVASGGVPPISYSWSNGGSSSCISNVSAGTYTVTVTDNNTCSATEQVVVTNQNVNIAVNGSQTVVATCGSNTNSVVINWSGGSAVYTASLSGPSTTANVATFGTTANWSGLAVGTYTATVTDANGCTGTTTIVVSCNQPCPTISVNGSQTVVATCGSNTNSVVINWSGGSAVYTASLSGPSTTANVATFGTTANWSGLAIGTYTATVTDANGCTGTTTIVVSCNQPCPTISSSQFLIKPTCNSCNGSLKINFWGGSPNYSVNLFGAFYNQTLTGSNSVTFSNLCDGITYSSIITDANGCTTNTSTAVSCN